MKIKLPFSIENLDEGFYKRDMIKHYVKEQKKKRKEKYVKRRLDTV